MKSDVQQALVTAGRPAGPGSLRAEFRFAPECAVFAGHFPGHPLLPGVLQVEMVRCALEAVAGPQEMVGVRRAKFTGEIRPGDVILLEAAVAPDGASGCTVKAELRVGADLKASLAIAMRSKP